MGDFLYTCVQLIHNFGAVTVVGSPVAALWLGNDHPSTQYRLAWMMALGWTAQGASGAGFGLTSLYLKGQIPDVTGVALVSLLIKIACVVTAVILAVVYLRAGSNWSPLAQFRLRGGMLILAATALSAAAFLRWYL
jgi:hypothetical protein